MTTVPKSPVTREALIEELASNLRVGILTGLIGGLILGFLFAAATLALNPVLLGSLRDVLILLLGLQAVYSIFCLALGILGAFGKSLIFAQTGRRLSDTKTAAFVSGAVFFAITAFYGYSWCRWHRIGGLSPERLPGWSDLPMLLAIAAVAALLARLMTYAFYLLIIHFKKPERRQPGDFRKAVFVLIYMAGAFAVFVGALILSGAPTDAHPGLSREEIVPAPAPVVLLAVDGMDRLDVERLDREGLLDWATPLHGGREGPITPPPPRSIPPETWTLVATGQTLEAHGIVDYETQVVRGLSKPFTVGPNQVGLFPLFQDVLPFFRLTRPVPMRSYMRATKGLWNLATDGGLKTVVVDWWVSWPAEKIRGRVVSDHAYLRLSREDASAAIRTDRETYPGSLLLELAPFAAPSLPDSLARRFGPPIPARALREFDELDLPEEVLRSDLFYARSATYLLEKERPDLWMLYLPGPDILRRLVAKRSPDPDRRQAALEQALRAYWSAVGAALRPCFARAEASGARMIWISLPGRRMPSRGSNEAGTFALAGPGVAAGELDRPFTPGEIAPTVLWLLGLPASREMTGEPRTEVLDPGAASPLLPIRWIESYGRREVEETDRGAGVLDREMIERFRSLGYIGG
jgi:hypothetical protein